MSMVALWIQEQSEGRTRLAIVGLPRRDTDAVREMQRQLCAGMNALDDAQRDMINAAMARAE